MAKAVVVGTRKLDFTTTNGDEIRGTNIFITYPDENVNGQVADKIFISKSSKIDLPVFKFGKMYDFIYDGFGKKSKLVEIREVV